MKNTAKDFIRRRIINMVMVIIITFIFGITYLGLHQADIKPVEKIEQVEITPET